MELQLKQQPHKNNIAFVLGNGLSRLKLKHQNLLDKGTVYGCNAIYREFSPHYLIAVDVKMVNEIIAAGYATKENQVWTNPNKGISTKENINLFNPHKGWSSGPTALWMACSHGAEQVYIFGFDYQGLKGRFNNVYADTFNYKKATDNATFHGNWLNQTEKIIKEFKNIKFYRVIDTGGFIPDQLGKQHLNLQHINYSQFKEKFPD
jgi:hypothetical protein